MQVLDRAAPGIAEAIRADSIAKTPHALLSRGIAGVCGCDAGRQPARLARRLPRRLRGAAACARARAPAARRRHRSRVTGRREHDERPRHDPRRFASLVKIEHTVFALPFAYVGAFLAVDAVPSAHDLVWITVAMVGARSLAMALNRLIDAEIDARNPRTAGRELPAGPADPGAGRRSSASRRWRVFLVAVWQLDPICRWLWPIPVAGFVVYPYLKRVTWLAHLWLGAVDGLAPMGAWIAIRGDLPWQAWALGGAVATLGRRVRPLLLALRRRDRPGAGPALVGDPLGRARRLPSARGCCTCSPSGCSRQPGPGSTSALLYWLGVAVVAGLLSYEHSLVRPGDLRRLDAAFFTMNGVISVTFFALRPRRRPRPVIAGAEARPHVRREARDPRPRPRGRARRLPAAHRARTAPARRRCCG